MLDLSHLDSCLVLAPHPDDEVLGAGGTVARLAASGCRVKVVIVTRAPPTEVAEPVYDEALVAHQVLGVEETLFFDFPTAGLDTVAHRELNAALARVMAQTKPDVLLLPFIGDTHLDHAAVFRSAMVAARPIQPGHPRHILAYECLSETSWNAPHVTPDFVPNLFVDISDFISTKLAAMETYASQLKAFPHERSLPAIEALARLRGSTVHVAAAEAFATVRQLI